MCGAGHRDPRRSRRGTKTRLAMSCSSPGAVTIAIRRGLQPREIGFDRKHLCFGFSTGTMALSLNSGAVSQTGRGDNAKRCAQSGLSEGELRPRQIEFEQVARYGRPSGCPTWIGTGSRPVRMRIWPGGKRRVAAQWHLDRRRKPAQVIIRIVRSEGTRKAVSAKIVLGRNRLHQSSGEPAIERHDRCRIAGQRAFRKRIDLEEGIACHAAFSVIATAARSRGPT